MREKRDDLLAAHPYREWGQYYKVLRSPHAAEKLKLEMEMEMFLSPRFGRKCGVTCGGRRNNPKAESVHLHLKSAQARERVRTDIKPKVKHVEFREPARWR